MRSISSDWRCPEGGVTGRTNPGLGVVDEGAAVTLEAQGGEGLLLPQRLPDDGRIQLLPNWVPGRAGDRGDSSTVQLLYTLRLTVELYTCLTLYTG